MNDALNKIITDNGPIDYDMPYYSTLELIKVGRYYIVTVIQRFLEKKITYQFTV